MRTRLGLVVAAVLWLSLPSPPICLGWPDESRSSPGRGGTAEAGSLAFDENATTDQLLHSAREMFIARQYDLAEMLYKAILVREPNHLSAMLELAITYEATGQLQYARGLLERAMLLRPHDPDIIQRNTDIVRRLAVALQSEIDSLLANGGYERAIPKLAVLLTTQPENAELYYKKADCHLRLGNPRSAVADIDRALAIVRDQRYFDFKARAMAALNQKEIDALQLEARRAVRESPSKGNEDALRAIGRLLEVDPDNAWARQQFLALTENPAGGAGEATRLDRVNAWLMRAKQRTARVGNALLPWVEVVGNHVPTLLAILFVLAIANSPLTRAMAGRVGRRQSLSGRLDNFNVRELLSLVNTHRQTGALVLRTASGSGTLFFGDGEIYHFKSGREQGREALQGLLNRATEGSFLFKEGAGSKQHTIDTPLSLILMELPERHEPVTSQSILKKQKQQSKMKSLLGKTP
jgi:tetratricopeptide (TPR) repeat protein